MKYNTYFVIPICYGETPRPLPHHRLSGLVFDSFLFKIFINQKNIFLLDGVQQQRNQRKEGAAIEGSRQKDPISHFSDLNIIVCFMSRGYSKLALDLQANTFIRIASS